MILLNLRELASDIEKHFCYMSPKIEQCPMDGTLYAFVRRNRRESDKVPYDLLIPPTNLQQPNKTPEDSTLPKVW